MAERVPQPDRGNQPDQGVRNHARSGRPLAGRRCGTGSGRDRRNPAVAVARRTGRDADRNAVARGVPRPAGRLRRRAAGGQTERHDAGAERRHDHAASGLRGPAEHRLALSPDRNGAQLQMARTVHPDDGGHNRPGGGRLSQRARRGQPDRGSARAGERVAVHRYHDAPRGDRRQRPAGPKLVARRHLSVHQEQDQRGLRRKVVEHRLQHVRLPRRK
ncbi:hypothetical protein SDC9_148088 [bioreactor metagenome]|uniref:Uncharacterized protein n=1 Tax=bioreactor metagenome TaxID=1076179 RepID=A0A645EHT9_9ZZZZ